MIDRRKGLEMLKSHVDRNLVSKQGYESLRWEFVEELLRCLEGKE